MGAAPKKLNPTATGTITLELRNELIEVAKIFERRFAQKTNMVDVVSMAIEQGVPILKEKSKQWEKEIEEFTKAKI